MEACDITPPGWRPMSSAPRDGTVIEVRNAFGLLPTYSIDKWADFGGQLGWVDAKPRPPCHDPAPVLIKDKAGKTIGGTYTSSCFTTGFATDPGRAWRPYVGDPAAYRDHNPTMAEWRAAARR